MRKIILTILLIFVLPTLALAEKQMRNTNPSPEPVAEPTLGRHMQNRDPNPEVKKADEPALGHHMQNRDPNPEPAPYSKEQEKLLRSIPN